MKKKILMVLPKKYLDENQDGIGKIVYNIIPILLKQFNIDFLYLEQESSRPSGMFLVKRFFDKYIYTSEEFYARYSSQECISYLNKVHINYDVLHFVSSGPCSLFNLINYDLTQKSIFTLIDNKVLYQKRKSKLGYNAWIKSQIQTLRLNRFYRKLSALERPITFVSNVDSQHFIDNFNLGEKKDVYTIENGVHIIDDKNFSAAQHGSIVFHGDFTYEPNKIAAKYIIKFSEQYSNLQFTMFGRGSDIFTKSNVNGKGFVENVTSELIEGEIYFAPMALGSGIKNKILEAMSQGMVVITTEVGNDGIDITHGINGFIVNLNDQKDIYRLIMDIKTKTIDISNISINAKLYVKNKFSWNTKSLLYGSLYNGVDCEL